jgi:alpha-1,6-mannosyltransferase
MGTTMRLRFSLIERCAVLLFGGYLLFFLLRHDPYPRAVPGLLVIALPDYAQFNPVAQLNQRLGLSAAWFTSGGLLIVLVLLFIVYFRMLHGLRLQSQQNAQAPVENPRRVTKSHEKGQNFVALRVAWWIATAPDRRFNLTGILAGVLLFSLPLLLCPYLLSRDIYSYIMYGRIAALYGENPALTAPIAYAHDAFFPYLIAWQSTPSVYGPVWTLFSHGLTLVVERAGGALWLYLLAYKLTMLAAHVANTVLIWQIMRAWRPEQQCYAALLYAWNPVALIEFVGNAHNDVLMIGLILLAILCTQRGYWRLALLALLAAALVKWVAVLLLPLWAIYWLRGPITWPARLLLVGQAAGILIIGATLLYLPYGQVLESISAPVRAQGGMQAENSLGALAIRGGQEALVRLGVDSARDPAWRPAAEAAVAWCSKGLVLVVWLVALSMVWRRPTFERLLHASCWLLLALLLIAPIFRVWYVTWPLTLVALLDWRPAGRAISSLVAAAPFMYIQAQSPAWLDALIFLPVIVLLAYELWHARRHRHLYTNVAHGSVIVSPRSEASTDP